MKTPYRFALALFVLFAVSCASVGHYSPIAANEKTIGTVQISFAARDLWFQKNEIINMQAYIKLLEAAAQKYSGAIDVRDIVWVTGRTLGNNNVEVSATGKVIRIGKDEQ